MYSRSVVLSICFLCFIACQSVVGQDWPEIRGRQNGVISPNGILSKKGDVELKVRWKKSIGSGYSSVAIAGKNLLTMYAGKKDDYLACFDTETGDEKWKVSVGPTFIGKNGSFDGPLSTPAIYKNLVFGLSANGRLVGVDLATGQLKWTRELSKDEDAPLPLYGFSTSPIIVADTILLQIGAKDRALVGIDPTNGKTKWGIGNDSVSSQSPTVKTIDGKTVVLATGGKKFTGVDPKDGRELFSVPHTGGNGSAMTPVDIGNNRILLTLDDSFSKAFSMVPSDNKFRVSESWKNRSIKNTYNIPVVHENNIYAFSTRFLTSVNSQTGKANWRQREPGDGFMIVVDGHLVISTKQGGLHIAKASPESYENRTSLKVFNDLNWSLPAYSNDSIYSRSFTELARIDIVSRTKTLTKSDKSMIPMGKKFNAFVTKVQSLDSAKNKKTAIDEFLKSQTSFPIIEGNVAHFVYQGKSQDVALACDMFGARQEKKMTQLEGTDFYFHTIQLAKDQRANYIFLVDYKPQTDPLNSRSTTSSMYAGEMEFAVRLRGEKPLEMSWFAMNGWKKPVHYPVLESKIDVELKGEQITSKVLGGKLQFDVYLPPNYEKNSEDRFPVVYFPDASALQLGHIEKAAHKIFGSKDSQRQAILVFIKYRPNPMSRTRATPGKAIATEVVPFIDKNFRTIADRQGRSVYGTGFASATALGLAGEFEDTFSAVSAQSPLIFDQGVEQLVGLYKNVKSPVRVYIEWGSYDMFNPHENWDIRSISKKIAEELKKNSNCKVTATQVNDSTDWASWQVRVDKVLGFLTDQ